MPTKRSTQNTGQSMDDVPVGGGRNRTRPSDIVDIYKIPEKWARLRLFGPVFAYAGHWVTTKNREGKKVQFYTPCAAFDPVVGKIDATLSCAWCKKKGVGDEDYIRFATDYYSNAIVRSLQKQKPSDLVEPTEEEAESGYKDKDSETWTPVRAVRLSTGPLRMMKDLKSLNVHENKDGDSEGYPVSHMKYGCDVSIKHNESAAPAQRYQVQKGDPTPLTKVEKTYLVYDLSELQVQPSFEETEEEYKKWFERMFKKSSKKSSDDDDDDDDPPPRKKRKVVDDDDEDPPPKKRKVVDEDEEDDDEPPKKKRKPPVDDDDDDEDPLPAKKKKPVFDDDDDDPPPKKKKRPVEDEEDDDDDDPPKKKRKPPVDEDEEDDDPPPKKKKPPVDEDEEDDDPPPKKKKRKVVEEDEEDEEDDPPPKKKKRPVDDDDLD